MYWKTDNITTSVHYFRSQLFAFQKVIKTWKTKQHFKNFPLKFSTALLVLRTQGIEQKVDVLDIKAQQLSCPTHLRLLSFP